VCVEVGYVEGCRCPSSDEREENAPLSVCSGDGARCNDEGKCIPLCSLTEGFPEGTGECSCGRTLDEKAPDGVYCNEMLNTCKRGQCLEASATSPCDARLYDSTQCTNGENCRWNEGNLVLEDGTPLQTNVGGTLKVSYMVNLMPVLLADFLALPEEGQNSLFEKVRADVLTLIGAQSENVADIMIGLHSHITIPGATVQLHIEVRVAVSGAISSDLLHFYNIAFSTYSDLIGQHQFPVSDATKAVLVDLGVLSSEDADVLRPIAAFLNSEVELTTVQDQALVQGAESSYLHMLLHFAMRGLEVVLYSTEHPLCSHLDLCNNTNAASGCRCERSESVNTDFKVCGLDSRWNPELGVCLESSCVLKPDDIECGDFTTLSKCNQWAGCSWSFGKDRCDWDTCAATSYTECADLGSACTWGKNGFCERSCNADSWLLSDSALTFSVVEGQPIQLAVHPVFTCFVQTVDVSSVVLSYEWYLEGSNHERMPLPYHTADVAVPSVVNGVQLIRNNQYTFVVRGVPPEPFAPKEVSFQVSVVSPFTEVVLTRAEAFTASSRSPIVLPFDLSNIASNVAVTCSYYAPDSTVSEACPGEVGSGLRVLPRPIASPITITPVVSFAAGKYVFRLEASVPSTELKAAAEYTVDIVNTDLVSFPLVDIVLPAGVVLQTDSAFQLVPHIVFGAKNERSFTTAGVGSVTAYEWDVPDYDGSWSSPKELFPNKRSLSTFVLSSELLQGLPDSGYADRKHVKVQLKITYSETIDGNVVTRKFTTKRTLSVYFPLKGQCSVSPINPYEALEDGSINSGLNIKISTATDAWGVSDASELLFVFGQSTELNGVSLSRVLSQVWTTTSQLKVSPGIPAEIVAGASSAELTYVVTAMHRRTGASGSALCKITVRAGTLTNDVRKSAFVHVRNSVLESVARNDTKKALDDAMALVTFLSATTSGPGASFYPGEDRSAFAVQALNTFKLAVETGAVDSAERFGGVSSAILGVVSDVSTPLSETALNVTVKTLFSLLQGAVANINVQPVSKQDASVLWKALVFVQRRSEENARRRGTSDISSQVSAALDQLAVAVGHGLLEGETYDFQLDGSFFSIRSVVLASRTGLVYTGSRFDVRVPYNALTKYQTPSPALDTIATLTVWEMAAGLGPNPRDVIQAPALAVRLDATNSSAIGVNLYIGLQPYPVSGLSPEDSIVIGFNGQASSAAESDQVRGNVRTLEFNSNNSVVAEQNQWLEEFSAKGPTRSLRTDSVSSLSSLFQRLRGCRFWNPETNSWSAVGVNLTAVSALITSEAGSTVRYECTTSHLTTFAVGSVYFELVVRTAELAPYSALDRVKNYLSKGKTSKDIFIGVVVMVVIVMLLVGVCVFYCKPKPKEKKSGKNKNSSGSEEPDHSHGKRPSTDGV